MVKQRQRKTLAYLLKEKKVKTLEEYERDKLKRRLKHKKTYIDKLIKGSIVGYFKVYLYKLKHNLKPNVNYNIDANYLHHLYNYQGGLCSYTGQELTTSGITDCITDAVIDLIDIQKGYVKQNVKLVARRIKYMKGPGMRPWMNDKDFVDLCREVAAFDILKKEVEDEQKNNSDQSDDEKNNATEK